MNEYLKTKETISGENEPKLDVQEEMVEDIVDDKEVSGLKRRFNKEGQVPQVHGAGSMRLAMGD